MKTIMILYLPGYGGHFLEALFSLDQSTVPCVPVDVNSDTPQTRAECYTRIKGPEVRHMGDIIQKNTLLESIPSYCQINVRSMHPQEYSYHAQDDCEKFIVDLDWSNFSNYWLVQSKMDFDYKIAQLRLDEASKNALLTRQYGIITINMNHMLDTERWQEEYLRITAAMNLPPHLESASMVYNYWYNMRVKKYVEEFKKLDTNQYARYCYLRLEEERSGTITKWKLFYERVRDASWPDCPNEDNFTKLPEHIRRELVEVFKYQPQTPS